MCGICGTFALDGRLDPDVRAALPEMTRALAHRGPDGQGTFADDRAALGHRRLAIIDVARGHQPIPNEDRSCWIVFNGEIYNHHALRRELTARGHAFQTRSDTEAILHAYEEYGAACVDRFEGMFAFAVYDARRGELFLARDRLGKKPLYYAILRGTLHFASEIKALSCSPYWDDAVDLSSLEGYLSLGYFLAPATVYRHVRSLEPGHWLIARGGQVRVQQYWDVRRFDDDRRDPGALAAELSDLMGSAVRDRLESEVPLGAFLSGGIDSGLVVSFMADALGDRVTTTSVGFGSAAHNELDAAAMTARRFHTRHHAEVAEPKLEEILDTIVEAFDQPFADSSAIPTYYVSAMARRHVTVALTGDGGDEVFGGYDFRYVPHALEDRARRLLPGLSGRWLARWLGRRWPRSPRLPRALRLSTILENLGDDPAAAYYSDLCFLKPAEARRLLGLRAERDPHQSPVFADVVDHYNRCPSASAVQRAQYADLKVYLPNDVLVKVDRMSMQHGLEVRCPLLDHRIVEFAFRVPTAAKMPRLESKHLLRRLGRDRLPPELLTLPKRGFTAPVGEWLRGPYGDQFLAEVTDARSTVGNLLDMTRLRNAFAEHRRGQADHSHLLWAAWVLERWGRLREQRLSVAGGAEAVVLNGDVGAPKGQAVASV